MPGGGELGGVGAELGDDGPAVDGADPGDLVQPVSEPEQEDAQVVAVGAWPPPASPQAVQAGAVPGTAASCCPICSSRAVISALIASISRRCSAISVA